MSDIVERLRNPQFDCAEEAADEIERLRAEVYAFVHGTDGPAGLMQAKEAAARSMRERASELAHVMRFDGHHISDAIDALPLIEDKP